MTMPASQIQKLVSGKPDFANDIQDKKVQLKRYNSDPPRYELYWPEVGKDVPVSLDNVEVLFSFAKVQRAIFERWKIVIEHMKPMEWQALITILNDSVGEIDAPGASEDAQVLDILERWIGHSNTTKWSAGDLDYKPLYRDGFFYFKISAFETHALFAPGSRFYYQRYDMPRSKLYKILGNARAETRVKKFKGVNHRVWQIPEDFNKPAEPAQGELIPEGEVGDKPEGEKGELIPEKDAPEGF